MEGSWGWERVWRGVAEVKKVEENGWCVVGRVVAEGNNGGITETGAFTEGGWGWFGAEE